jgi:Txe/YoeB family toxin of Txe-Axe toxin-antitoxin module
VSWGVVYYRAENGRVPAEEFLENLPSKVAARFDVVLDSVRRAPPPQFSGGGFWEAMHGTMNGYYEIRITGPGRMQHRLFCILDNADREGLERRGFDGPQIAVINGLSKKSGERFSDAEYKRAVRHLGDDYLKSIPRSVAE